MPFEKMLRTLERRGYFEYRRARRRRVSSPPKFLLRLSMQRELKSARSLYLTAELPTCTTLFVARNSFQGATIIPMPTRTMKPGGSRMTFRTAKLSGLVKECQGKISRRALIDMRAGREQAACTKPEASGGRYAQTRISVMGLADYRIAPRLFAGKRRPLRGTWWSWLRPQERAPIPINSSTA